MELGKTANIMIYTMQKSLITAPILVIVHNKSEIQSQKSIQQKETATEMICPGSDK